MLLLDRLGPTHLGFMESYIKEKSANLFFSAAAHKSIRDSRCDGAVIAHKTKMIPT